MQPFRKGNCFWGRVRWICCATALVLTGFQTNAAPSYQLTDLGNLAGNGSGALGINNAGQVVGWSGSHAFLYDHGVMTDLGGLSGGTAAATGINNRGQIAGVSMTAQNEWRAVTYDSARITDLGSLGGTNSIANGINDNGQVAGISQVRGNANYHAFLYSNGGMIDLGTLGSDTSSEANGINNHGQVVGDSFTESSLASHAFLYENGVMTDLGNFGIGGSQALAINDRGQIVGSSGFLGGPGAYSRAFLYEDGSMSPLGPETGFPSTALAINNFGQVVGYAENSGEDPFAVLWNDGAMIDLNSVVGSDSAWRLEHATGINDQGQIVGYGTIGSETRAFLLTPVPEPKALSLVILFSAILLRRASLISNLRFEIARQTWGRAVTTPMRKARPASQDSSCYHLTPACAC